MSKKRIIISCILFGIIVLFNVGIAFYNVPLKEYNLNISITCNMQHPSEVNLGYIAGNGDLETGFLPNKSVKNSYSKSNENESLSFCIPGDTRYISVSFNSQSNVGNISAISIKSGNSVVDVKPDDIMSSVMVSNMVTEAGDNTLNYAINDVPNSYASIVYDISKWVSAEQQQLGHRIYVISGKIIFCLVVNLLFLFVIFRWQKAAVIPKELWQNRKLIFQLAKNDFKTKFAGSYLGTIWAFVQPIVTVLVYWFVFEKGLKAGGVNTSSGISVPFVLWLVAGLVPWFFFSDAWNGGTNALIEYSYLVKKVVFKISILPIVKIVSAFFVHAFFVVFTLLLYSGYQYFPDLYTLQIIYYSLCTFMLVLGLSYATCALVGFFRDLTQIINIILQVGVWMTPIMWNIETMELSPILIKIFKLNPMYYVVAGYRDSLINKVWFWENPSLTIYFWAVTAALFAIGMFVFKRLKIHFADVL